jgi:hypothetical protein
MFVVASIRQMNQETRDHCDAHCRKPRSTCRYYSRLIKTVVADPRVYGLHRISWCVSRRGYSDYSRCTSAKASA